MSAGQEVNVKVTPSQPENIETDQTTQQGN